MNNVSSLDFCWVKEEINSEWMRGPNPCLCGQETNPRAPTCGTILLAAKIGHRGDTVWGLSK